LCFLFKLYWTRFFLWVLLNHFLKYIISEDIIHIIYVLLNKVPKFFFVHLINKPGQERSLSQARSLPCGMLTKLTTWWHLISRLWAHGSSMLALFLDGRYGAPSSRKWLRWADEKTMISNSHLVCSRDTHTQIRNVYDQRYTGKNPIYVKKWSISISFKNTLFQKQQRDHTEVLEIFHLFIKTHRKHEPATKELETQTPKSD